MKIINKEIKEFKLLLRSIPATVVTLFVVSVICMNLLANKTLIQLDWIALDGGILTSGGYQTSDSKRRDLERMCVLDTSYGGM